MSASYVMRVVIGIVVCHLAAPIAMGQGLPSAAVLVHPYWRNSTTKDINGNVVSLTLLSASDEEVESYDLSKFSKLEALFINSRYVTNRSLVHLRKLPESLADLFLIDTPVDDKEMVPLLQRLKSLRRLRLQGMDVSERTLTEIGKLSGLTLLGLKGAKFTDASLSGIENLRRLRHLLLSETPVTDRGLEKVRALKSLITIELAGTKITDAGLVNLAGIEGLVHVDLSNTKVTDEGILHLGALDNLRELNVSNTKVTQKGKAALKMLLPDLEFVTE
jgi:internalin A